MTASVGSSSTWTDGNASPACVIPYTPDYRDAIRRIYAETAFFGEPVETYFDDRNLFADLGIDTYLDHYPEYAWAAQSEGRIVGYIVGCPLGDGQMRRHNLARLPRILGRLAAGRYRVGRKTLAYLRDQALAALGGELLEIRSESYPANLHINLLPAHRGHGLGAALLRAYLRKLAADGVPGVHAVTTERNEAAVRLYRGFGFTVLAEATTHAWKRYVGGPLRLIAFGLRLSPDDFAEASAQNP